MKIDRVTITGADNSVNPEDLLALSAKYPFVEWGILASANNGGVPRYPDILFIHELIEEFRKSPQHAKFSLHICGRYVREILRGNYFLLLDSGLVTNQEKLFNRIQLNFHSESVFVAKSRFVSALKEFNQVYHFIFQLDGQNEKLMNQVKEAGISNVYGLYDLSGGRGISPDKWPVHTTNDYVGYAGGITPDNILEQINKIALAAPGKTVWIDMESGVRGKDNEFDLEKVESCLRQVQHSGFLTK